MRRLKLATENLDRLANQRAIARPATLAGDDRSLAEAFRVLLGLPAASGNDIELLPDADAGFTSLLSDVQNARYAIDMEFYIWSDGGRADEFAEALLAAVRRGVKCRLLVDAIGSSSFLSGSMFTRLRSGGVEVLVALPSGFWRSLLARPDLRIHRKIVVVDHAIAYTGSMNLADPKFFKIDAGVGQWVDALARIRGPAASLLHGIFLADWCAENGADFSQEVSQLSTQDAAQTQTAMPAKAATIQVLPSGPAVRNSAIEQALIMCLYSARRELTLTTPYFVPSEALMFALTAAARRGVRTTLIVPARVDSRLTHHASRSFYQDLITAGVDVALYQGGLLHTKSVTVDGEFSLFGSLNLDPRSLRINFEITLAVYSAEFTQELKRLQDSYVAQAKLYTAEDIARQTTMESWLGDLARLVGPLL